MHKEAAYKLHVGECYCSSWVSRLPASCREGCFCIIHRDDPAVGYRNLMCISPEVFDRVAKSIECLLDVRTPVFLIKGVSEGIPFIGIAVRSA